MFQSQTHSCYADALARSVVDWAVPPETGYSVAFGARWGVGWAIRLNGPKMETGCQETCWIQRTLKALQQNPLETSMNTSHWMCNIHFIHCQFWWRTGMKHDLHGVLVSIIFGFDFNSVWITYFRHLGCLEHVRMRPHEWNHDQFRPSELIWGIDLRVGEFANPVSSRNGTGRSLSRLCPCGRPWNVV